MTERVVWNFKAIDEEDAERFIDQNTAMVKDALIWQIELEHGTECILHLEKCIKDLCNTRADQMMTRYIVFKHGNCTCYMYELKRCLNAFETWPVPLSVHFTHVPSHATIVPIDRYKHAIQSISFEYCEIGTRWLLKSNVRVIGYASCQNPFQKKWTGVEFGLECIVRNDWTKQMRHYLNDDNEDDPIPCLTYGWGEGMVPYWWQQYCKEWIETVACLFYMSRNRKQGVWGRVPKEIIGLIMQHTEMFNPEQAFAQSDIIIDVARLVTRFWNSQSTSQPAIKRRRRRVKVVPTAKDIEAKIAEARTQLQKSGWPLF